MFTRWEINLVLYHLQSNIDSLKTSSKINFKPETLALINRDIEKIQQLKFKIADLPTE